MVTFSSSWLKFLGHSVHQHKIVPLCLKQCRLFQYLSTNVFISEEFNTETQMLTFLRYSFFWIDLHVPVLRYEFPRDTKSFSSQTQPVLHSLGRSLTEVPWPPCGEWGCYQQKWGFLLLQDSRPFRCWSSDLSGLWTRRALSGFGTVQTDCGDPESQDPRIAARIWAGNHKAAVVSQEEQTTKSLQLLLLLL